MKKIVCEMCGGNEFAKADGMFVCQSCGMKYSLEEARGLMVEEKTSEIKQEVSTDPTEILNNLYVVARRARDDENSKLAQNYYQKIMEYAPNSWEAYFYCIYFEAMDTNIANISSAITKLYNCIDTVLGQIKEHVKGEETQKTLREVVKRTMHACSCMRDAAYEHYSSNASISGVAAEYEARCAAIRSAYFKLYDCLKSFFPESEVYKTYGGQLLVDGLNCILLLESVNSNADYNNHVEEIMKLYPEEYEKTEFCEKVKAEKAVREKEEKEAEENYKRAVKEYPKWRTAFILLCCVIPALLGIVYFYYAVKDSKSERLGNILWGVLMILTVNFVLLGLFYDILTASNNKKECRDTILKYEIDHNMPISIKL